MLAAYKNVLASLIRQDQMEVLLLQNLILNKLEVYMVLIPLTLTKIPQIPLSQ